MLLAIGLPHEIAHGSLRLTLGADNTEEDVDYVLRERCSKIGVERLRADVSAVWLTHEAIYMETL